MAIEDHFEFLQIVEKPDGTKEAICPYDPLPTSMAEAAAVPSTPCWASAGRNPRDGRMAFIETGGCSSVLMVHMNRVALGISWVNEC